LGVATKLDALRRGPKGRRRITMIMIKRMTMSSSGAAALHTD
jgi:hypothetical protein